MIMVGNLRPPSSGSLLFRQAKKLVIFLFRYQVNYEFFLPGNDGGVPPEELCSQVCQLGGEAQEEETPQEDLCPALGLLEHSSRGFLLHFAILCRVRTASFASSKGGPGIANVVEGELLAGVRLESSSFPSPLETLSSLRAQEDRRVVEWQCTKIFLRAAHVFYLGNPTHSRSTN